MHNARACKQGKKGKEEKLKDTRQAQPLQTERDFDDEGNLLPRVGSRLSSGYPINLATDICFSSRWH
jgi:hypothetical protein